MAGKWIKVSAEIKQEDFTNLIKQLEKFSLALRKKIAVEGMMAGGQVHLEAAKVLVPKGATKGLVNSLTIGKLRGKSGDAGGARVYAQRSGAYVGGYYAHLVENGHRIFLTTRNKRQIYVGYYAGKPFMRPALEQNREKILSAIKKSIGTEIGRSIAKKASRGRR